MLSDKLWDKFFDLLFFLVTISLFFIAPLTQVLGVMPADSQCYESKLVEVKHYIKVEDRGILADKYNIKTKDGKTLTLTARVVRENAGDRAQLLLRAVKTAVNQYPQVFNAKTNIPDKFTYYDRNIYYDLSNHFFYLFTGYKLS